ncbi:S-adenosyl-L-methionine-dependent methyltransferase [Dactylonectria estremocensis]|uniref:S-adenosyl-L-methionine-dependent methyltransferase n=1 Tax=Dactylonectria estremocensis TaxID=1079267 RepID=A0A9P9ECK9_9HYPO|nr:S-adenosyl-L-methionine-dependent methyltransferase [Dactylonectria estremocensis]
MADSNPVLLADDQLDHADRDSSLGSDAGSSTQSISSSILEYRRENGRTYHAYKDGKYNLPNDDLENERLDLQHHLCLLTFNNQLGLAPPCLPNSKVKRVLDVGTGTGIWAIDFGDEHVESQVVGVDLSPSQPSVVPPNVRFIIDDIDEEWNHSEPFDYIHSRMMNFSIKDWPTYFRNVYDNLAPGGWVEIQEVGCEMASDDNTVTKDTALFKWCKLLDEAAANLGRPFVKFDEMKEHMASAGFTGIVDGRFKWPTNRWPKEKKFKELGAWNNENTVGVLEALTLAPFTRGLGWSYEEVTLFLSDVRTELNDPKIHAYWPICSIYGKKPEAD